MAPLPRARERGRALRVRLRPGTAAGLTPAIDARGWGWRHSGRRSFALRRVDLRVERGERVLLLGASGAGKSTLLLALAGVLGGAGDPEGELAVFGSAPDRARGECALVFQDPDSQLVMHRVGDEVAFGLEERCVPGGEIWPRVDSALAAVGLDVGRDRATSALSGGEQQRLAIAAALALEPRLMLLDEPTANLDPASAAQVREALGATGAGTTLVLVEHRVGESLPLVDRVVVLDGEHGVVADGAPATVFSAHGAALAASGVWVPGHPPAIPSRPRKPAGDVAITAHGVAFRYPGAAREAIAEVDVALRAGETVAVTGASASGKSTLALVVAGLLRPTRGELAPPLWRWPARELVRRVGSVFQDPEHQFVTSRVDEELALGPLRGGASAAAARERAATLLGRLRLEHLAAANPFTLSGGEQRRLSVATALATAPTALVLDEPTFAQDRRTYAEIVSLLAEFRDAGGALLVATHDVTLTAALADRVVPLERGRVAA